MTSSESDRLRSARHPEIPYGETVVVDTGIGKLTVDTSALPVDPGTKA
ncbi:hypothetical protein ACGFYU_30765 [Streptomyces sp. NPDC048337]